MKVLIADPYGRHSRLTQLIRSTGNVISFVWKFSDLRVISLNTV
jgi:hypothetical protein